MTEIESSSFSWKEKRGSFSNKIVRQVEKKLIQAQWLTWHMDPENSLKHYVVCGELEEIDFK